MNHLEIPHEEVFVWAGLKPNSLKVLFTLIVLMKRAGKNYLSTSINHLTYYAELSPVPLMRALQELKDKNIITRRTHRYQKDGKYVSLSVYTLQVIRIKP